MRPPQGRSLCHGRFEWRRVHQLQRNPGMATPGMGDALSGMVGALLARRMPPFEALTLGVFLHGYAADRVAARMGRVGYLAGDVIDDLPAAMEAVTRGRAAGDALH